jgi:hypothetical protein
MELNRWMRRVHLPRTNLRRLYVQLKHAFHVIDGSCTYSALINAMQTLMCGCMGADDADRSSPTESLRHAIADLCSKQIPRVVCVGGGLLPCSQSHAA